MKVSTITKRYAKSPSEDERAKCKELMKKNQKEDEKLRKGVFEFSDANGGWFEFCCRLYPGEITKYYIAHGETCEIPQGVVKLLNNCYRKVRRLDDSTIRNLDESPGNKFPVIWERTARVRFIPLDVM